MHEMRTSRAGAPLPMRATLQWVTLGDVRSLGYYGPLRLKCERVR